MSPARGCSRRSRHRHPHRRHHVSPASKQRKAGRHRTATAPGDEKIRQVITFTENGWPSAVAPDLPEVYAARGYLSKTCSQTNKPLLMYNNRLVIPDALCREMLRKLHDDGHLSLVKCRQRIAESVWWQGINRQLKEWIDRCGFCQEHRRRHHAEPLQPTELADGPWSQVGVGFATYEGRQCLVVVDYFSCWLELLHMTSTTSASTIDRLRGLFARFGIPETMRSDGDRSSHPASSPSSLKRTGSCTSPAVLIIRGAMEQCKGLFKPQSVSSSNPTQL